MTYFPGYGWLGPAFHGRRHRIPEVAPVAPPAAALPGAGPPLAAAGNPQLAAPPNPAMAAPPNPAALGATAPVTPGAPGWARVTPPRGGSPLTALMGLPIWPQVAQLLSRVPDLASAPSPLPQAPPGMPEIPPPPPGMFTGAPAGGLLQPIRLPEWYGKLQPSPAAVYGQGNPETPLAQSHPSHLPTGV